jgi:uncharacterized protein YtpQ (UPF0354 family)
MGTGKGFDSVYEQCNEELLVFYAEDTPTNIRYLTPSTLAALNLELKDLRKLACDNLQRLVPVPDIQQQGGIYRIRASGDYDASFLLVDDFWEHATIEVAGEIVAAVPARDFLAVTGSQNTEAVRRLKAMAKEIASRAPYRLTPKLFVRRQGSFVPYEE